MKKAVKKSKRKLKKIVKGNTFSNAINIVNIVFEGLIILLILAFIIIWFYN